jgi:hypothetical protein
MRIYPWDELPACLSRQIRKLEACATARKQLPLALTERKASFSMPDAPRRRQPKEKRIMRPVVMLVLALCLAPQCPASSEEAAPQKTPPKDTGRIDRQHTHCSFKKRGRLIARPPGMSKPGPFCTTVVKMDGVSRFPTSTRSTPQPTTTVAKGGSGCTCAMASPRTPIAGNRTIRRFADGDFGYLREKPAANPIFVDSGQAAPLYVVLEGVRK